MKGLVTLVWALCWWGPGARAPCPPLKSGPEYCLKNIFPNFMDTRGPLTCPPPTPMMFGFQIVVVS